MRARHLHSVPIDGFAQARMDDDGCPVIGVDLAKPGAERTVYAKIDSMGSVTPVNSAQCKSFSARQVPDTITSMEIHGLRTHEEFDALQGKRYGGAFYDLLVGAKPAFLIPKATRWQRFRLWLTSVRERMVDDSEPL